MFSSKSSQNPPSSGTGEQFCMADCSSKPECTCDFFCGKTPCASELKRNSPDLKGFDNLAYEYDSQRELHSPPKPGCRATFKLLGLTLEHRVVETTASQLNGVLAVILSGPDNLLQVDYDASITSTEEIALQLQTLGCIMEAAVQIKVDGMRCQSCVQSIKGSIGGLSGVLHIQVSLQDSRAVIVYHPVLITQQGLRNKIQDLGFEATLMPEVQSGGGLVYWQKDLLDIPIHTVTIWIGGMTCISCVRSIESRVSQITGVKFVTVSLEEAKGTITFDPSLMKPEHLRTTIEELGFDASFGEPLESIQTRENPNLANLQSSSRAAVSNGSGSCKADSPEIKVQKCFVCVTGMTCSSCVANIELHMLKHKGIISVLVSLMAGKAEVKYNPEVLNATTITQLIQDLGFGAKLIEDNAVSHGKLDLHVSGMMYASCVHNIESKLTTTKGILSASVALATKKASIHFDPEIVGVRDIIKIIQSLGFEANLEKGGFKNNLDHTEEIQQQVSVFK